MESTIQLALIISLASLGFRAITGKGMILYFLRKPFDKMKERKNLLNVRVQTLIDLVEMSRQSIQDNDISTKMGQAHHKDCIRLINKSNKEINSIPNSKRIDWILYLAKPILLCSTCMASVHTLIWFPIITGEFFTANLILVMLMVATLNTLIWAVVEMVQKNS